MTMGASIECRVPFLDYRLVEQLSAMSSSRLLSLFHTKPLLRKSVGQRLPGSVRHARKWGFGVPWAKHLRSIPSLRNTVESLPGHASMQASPCDTSAIQKMVTRFLSGDGATDHLITQLVMLAAWFDSGAVTQKPHE
jgi:asparagine synthase (glutamine-hydrolysing)